MSNDIVGQSTLTFSQVIDMAWIYETAVTTTLVPIQTLGKTFPEVTSTLTPTQTIVGVLPSVTSTLVPVQTIETNFKHGTVTHTLVPVQTVGSHSTWKQVSSTLIPVQTIVTSSSTLSESSVQAEEVVMGLTITTGGTFNKAVASSLVPRQGTGSVVTPRITIGSEDFYTKDIYPPPITNYITSVSSLTFSQQGDADVT